MKNKNIKLTHRMRLYIGLLLSFMALVAAQAQAPRFSHCIIDTTGFTAIHPKSYSSGGIGAGDDGSYMDTTKACRCASAIKLNFDFYISGVKYDSIFININGNVTFGAAYSTYSSEPLSSIKVPAMVAPFWADVDLLLPVEGGTGKYGQGKIFYQSNPTNFIILWKDVGYYQNSVLWYPEQTNTFQLVITNGNDPILPGNSNVGFYYDKMNWTTGSASSGYDGYYGVPATVGITNGQSSFSIGRFDHEGKDYVGTYLDENSPKSTPERTYYDGVQWLEKRCDLVYNVAKELVVVPSPCNKEDNTYGITVYPMKTNNIPLYSSYILYLDGVPSAYSFNSFITLAGKPLTLGNLPSDGKSHELKVVFVNGTRPLTVTYQAPDKCGSECVSSFAPIPGNTYLLSAWVKEDFTGISPATYMNSGIQITFDESQTLDVFRPSGPIIDGWQRIESSFTVPLNSRTISIDLVNNKTSGDVYYDDIRLHPFKSNFKSFVYDPHSQKLVAELDENNFSTRYEYDDEGTLIRVKKETERGVMTLKEIRSNQSKIFK